MMLTRNLIFKNFKNSISKKKLKNKIKNFYNINLTHEYPLLKSFNQNYKYSYKKNFIKKFNKNFYFNIIGMGGSVLGTEAIYSFLNHKIKKKFEFINNLNPKTKKTKNSVNIIISKSGETLETISNFHILQKLNKSKNNIFISEHNKNYIRKIAARLKCEIIEHKNYIGGRYSVLSEVGMLPAEIMGLQEKKFKKLNILIKNKKFVENLIINVENTLKFINQKKVNSIILNYDEKSDNLFRWYQQLIAESLGKKSKGLIPIISSMPKDNHSLLQLYLDGPKNSFFTFYNVMNDSSDIISPKYVLKSKNYLKNKSLNNIINAQKLATQKVFSKKNIPFRIFEIKKRSEETLGELFSFFVLETILLGRALNINPFDQPAVELIKTETRKILS